MKQTSNKQATERREFIKHVATGAAALSMTMLASPLKLSAEQHNHEPSPGDADEWFNQLDKKGKHRIVFDVVKPNGVMPFAWPKVFQLTNVSTGAAEKDLGLVVILRHEGIPFAMGNQLWEKYKFGEMFKVDDPKTQKPSVRNMFWQPAPGDFKVPGIGEVEIGVNQLQDHGVMFCVCNMALMVLSAEAAQSMNMDATAVYNEWKAGVLPGIQVVPSGVWAVGRAQEHGCAYCYAS
jgi:intracellular sulfur oxidation DsrE/DsrF family protein